MSSFHRRQPYVGHTPILFPLKLIYKDKDKDKDKDKGKDKDKDKDKDNASQHVLISPPPILCKPLLSFQMYLIRQMHLFGPIGPI